MNTSLRQTSSTSTLVTQIWGRVQSYSLVDSLKIGGSSLRGTSLFLLVEKVGERATFIWSLIPFTLFTVAKLPWAAVQVGVSVKDCLTACDLGERLERGLEILEALGNMCFAGITTTVAVCQYLGRCTPWLFPIGVAGGVLQSGGIIASIHGIARDKRFAKEMNQAEEISKDEALIWLSKQHPGLLKERFRLLEGNDLIRFAKDLLNDSQSAYCKNNLLTLLKGRLRNTIRGDLVKLTARIVGIAGLPLLLINPSVGLAFSAVSSTLHAVVPIRDNFFDH